MKYKKIFIAALCCYMIGSQKNTQAQGVVNAGLISRYCFDGNAEDAIRAKNCSVYGPVLTTDRKGKVRPCLLL